jgi:hypothetical protein
MDLVMVHWGGTKEWVAPFFELATIAIFVIIGYALRGVEK